MAVGGWWLPEIREELSQGDVLGPLEFFAPVWPLQHLRHTDIPKKGPGWVPAPEATKAKNGLVHVLGHIKSAPGIIISHDCEIDKPNKGTRVQLAHVVELKSMPEELATNVREQKSFRYMPLPEMPIFGDCAVDFRAVTGFPVDVIHSTAKVASLTDDARIRLQAALWAFITHREEFGDPKTEETAKP